MMSPAQENLSCLWFAIYAQVRSNLSFFFLPEMLAQILYFCQKCVTNCIERFHRKLGIKCCTFKSCSPLIKVALSRLEFVLRQVGATCAMTSWVFSSTTNSAPPSTTFLIWASSSFFVADSLLIIASFSRCERRTQAFAVLESPFCSIWMEPEGQRELKIFHWENKGGLPSKVFMICQLEFNLRAPFSLHSSWQAKEFTTALFEPCLKECFLKSYKQDSEWLRKTS